MKKNAECILKPTVVTLQCFSATLNLRLHSRLVWSQYRYQSAISLQRFVLQSAHIHIQWCSPPRGNALVTIISFPKGDAFILTQHPLFIPLSLSLITHMQNHLLKAFHPDFFHTFILLHIHSSFRLTLTHIRFIPPPTHTHQIPPPSPPSLSRFSRLRHFDFQFVLLSVWKR